VRTRMHAREKSLKNFGPVPSVGFDPSPLCCRSCRRRSWSGWGGIEHDDGIVDLGAAAGLEKTNKRGSNRLRSGSKPNAIGAEHNEAIGRRMTHSQGSNDSGLIVSHPWLFQGHSILSHP
jgi:hypothetical protein